MNSFSSYTRTAFMYRDHIVSVTLSSSLCGANFSLCILPFVDSLNFLNKFLGNCIPISTFFLIIHHLAFMHSLRKSGKRSEHQCLAIYDPNIIRVYRYYLGITSVHTALVEYIQVERPLHETIKVVPGRKVLK